MREPRRKLKETAMSTHVSNRRLVDLKASSVSPHQVKPEPPFGLSPGSKGRAGLHEKTSKLKKAQDTQQWRHEAKSVALEEILDCDTVLHDEEAEREAKHTKALGGIHGQLEALRQNKVGVLAPFVSAKAKGEVVAGEVLGQTCSQIPSNTFERWASQIGHSGLRMVY
jgi:hypothetical protein